jgi:hypothetical protein
MTPSNPFEPPTAVVRDVTPPAPAQGKDLAGLGGWLILVGFGVVVSPLRILGQVFPVYGNMLSNGAWARLTTPGSEAYHPLWQPILVAEIGINAALVLTWLFIAFLFFTKRRLFPKVYIGTLLFTLAFVVGDALAIQLVLPQETAFDEETTKQVMQTVVAVMIWTPYMLVSKRVKATFVR